MERRYFEDKDDKRGFYYEVIKKTGIKNLNIKVLKNGKIQVIVPRVGFYSIGQKRIEKILEERFDFVTTALERYEKLSQKYPDLFTFEEKHYRRYRQTAQELIKAKVDYYCRQYDFRYNRISIRNQSTRWGSCSAQGNLNFSYKIIFLLPEEQDYIIVHELCHLEEQNHSRDFWNLVKKILPEYKKIHKNIQNKS
jgi:predicted metal-dependent hydrolase